jgi:hypothetical protein
LVSKSGEEGVRGQTRNQAERQDDADSPEGKGNADGPKVHPRQGELPLRGVSVALNDIDEIRAVERGEEAGLQEELSGHVDPELLQE